MNKKRIEANISSRLQTCSNGKDIQYEEGNYVQYYEQFGEQEDVKAVLDQETNSITIVQ